MHLLNPILAGIIAVASIPTAIAAPTSNRPRTPFSNIITFGDSWTDNGNVAKLTNNTWPVPSVYYQGRFSNGPVWADVLVELIGGTLADFAYGSATTNSKTLIGATGADSSIPVPSVDQQIADKYAAYLSTNTLGPKPLHILWSGGNDFFFDQLAYKLNLTGAKIATDVLGNVQTLLSPPYNAKRILVINLPDLSVAPYFNTLGAAAADTKATFKRLADDFNDSLRGQVRAAKSAASGRSAKVEVFDVKALVRGFVKNPTSFGFTDSVNPCFDGKTVCGDADKRVFWDAFHFTAKAHRYIAEGVAAVVKRCLDN
ncbi:hypothetical protein HDU96_005646 [Phlyctochytrium bullatum]|nr:hypothetical protein HDU96_005646 [Phlyctochytrium bullatum]